MKKEDSLRKLRTEGRNPDTMDLDRMTSMEICYHMHQEDRRAMAAVSKVLPKVAEVIDAAVAALQSGGRIIYVGAGTSGMIALMDAAECPPTFGVSEQTVIALIAGGRERFGDLSVDLEDHAQQGEADLRGVSCSPRDLVIGIAASGRTPYVIGALRYAESLGCRTAAIACNAKSEIGRIAKIAVEPDTGEEVLTGSTRLKAGTAQKVICNMITTGAMVRCGKAYQNLMVDLTPSNEKLEKRSLKILKEATGASDERARELLESSGHDLKAAILMESGHCTLAEARKRLQEADGILRDAVSPCSPWYFASSTAGKQ